MQPTLYLRRMRDFGQKVSDSLLFLKQNWKRLMAIYFVFIIPFLLIACIAGYFFASHMISIVQDSAESLRPGDILNPEFFVMMACLIIAFTGYSTSVYAYIRLYDETNLRQATLQEVARLTFKKFLPVFLRMILVTIIVVLMFVPVMFLVGSMLQLAILLLLFLALFVGIAAIYLNAIFVLEDGGFAKGVARLFHLLRGKWWATIGYTIIIFMIYYFFAMILQFVASMIMGAASLSILTPNLDRSVMGAGKMAGMLVGIIGLLIILQQIFYIIVYCGIGVNYYSLVEEKDGTSIEQQINEIGTVNDQYGGVEETY